ncbi:MAG: UvrB/UvrC motif-containing protein [Sedimentisphaerales bacterium]|nr:UvrB/UvrC motif-containing protein [Sedimentisphaerales bacterium]
MQCEICKIKTATVHLTEIVDGKRKESHLCQACAQQEGIAIKSQLSLNELLSSLIAAHQQADGQEAQMTEQVCPVCGMTMEIFRKNALLGCPKDYDIFAENLQQILEKAHDGNMIHKGKIPPGVSKQALIDEAKKDEAKTEKENNLASLRKRLDEAVAREDYELAAKLRDQLKELQ